MLKKILMAIGALAIVAVIAVVGISYYVYNKFNTEFEKREPEFRQYVTMTTEEQNAYVDKNIDEMYRSMSQFLDEDSENDVNSMLKVLSSGNPELRQAKINWGRSAIAYLILENSNIRKDLSAEVLKQLEAEVAEYEVRRAEYRKQINMQKLQE